jgi:Lrp/AsnC family transcriptional regulator for asnA, asnC and gidA
MDRDNIVLDKLDRQIISELQSNGRESYKTIARKLNVSGGTVRLRVKRMIKKNVLRISALLNPFLFEHSITALIGMQLENRPLRETMERILKLSGVLSVSNATGEFDLIVEVFLESRGELKRFLIEELTKIDGIKSTETFVFLDGLNKWVELKSSEP